MTGPVLPERYRLGAGAWIPASTAAALDRFFGWRQLARVARVAGRAETAAVCTALADTADQWRASTAGGTTVAIEPEPGPPCRWMNTTAAAHLLGITPRGVVAAIHAGRLAAEQVDGRWRIDREHAAQYRADRHHLVGPTERRPRP